jgi:hypothetical protein
VGLPSCPVDFSSLHHSHKLSHSWLLGTCPTPAKASLACQTCLFTVPGRIPFPQSLALSVLHPLSRMSLLFLLLISQLLFFPPGWRSVCPWGYAALAQGCLWVYRGTTKLTLSASSQAIWARAAGSPGALLIFPFNVKWRCSAPPGGVEGSKLSLFSVIMPAKCVSSVSPRFHYRRLTFCFLPLAAILESPAFILLILSQEIYAIVNLIFKFINFYTIFITVFLTKYMCLVLCF